MWSDSASCGPEIYACTCKYLHSMYCTFHDYTTNSGHTATCAAEADIPGNAPRTQRPAIATDNAPRNYNLRRATRAPGPVLVFPPLYFCLFKGRHISILSLFILGIRCFGTTELIKELHGSRRLFGAILMAYPAAIPLLPFMPPILNEMMGACGAICQ